MGSVTSYANLGFKKALVLSGHFETEHFKAIGEGIGKVPTIQATFMTALDFTKDQAIELEDINLTWPFAGDHAAEWETSMMLHYFPKLVSMKSAPETIELDMSDLPEYIRKRYPRRANKDYGRKLAKAVLAGGVRVINEMMEQ